MSTVVITKAIDDSERFYSLLESRNLDYFHLPCIEFIKPSDDYIALDKVIRENHHYDWVVFLSKKAAEVFFSRLLELGGHFFHLSPRLKIACVGQTTADFIINEIGFPVNFIPSEFNSACLATEFIEKFCDGDSASGMDPIELILPRAENINDDLVAKLESTKQIKVTLVNAYRTIIPEVNSFTLEKFDKLLDNDEELFISFTSSEIVRNFKKNIGINRLQKITTRNNLHLISIGPKTSITIKEEFPLLEANINEAPEATLEAMVDLTQSPSHSVTL